MTHAQASLILKEHGIRPTLQRVEIAMIVLSQHWHLTAASLSEKVNKLYPKVARASIFNTLKLFEEKGLLKRIEVSNDETYYDSNIEPHHHVIDKNEKRIYDIHLPSNIENKIKEIMKKEMQKQNLHLPDTLDINVTAFIR